MFRGGSHLNLRSRQIGRGEEQLVDPGAVGAGEEDLVGGAALLGQDHLPAGGILGVGQDKLLLAGGRRLQGGDNLDLLMGIGHNLEEIHR